MNAVAPLIGIVVLCVVLTANFFRAAWKLGLLRSFGRRMPLRWRTIAAGAMAACLPFVGGMAAILMVPAGAEGALLPITPIALAIELASAGFVTHWLNDKVMAWGACTPS